MPLKRRHPGLLCFTKRTQHNTEPVKTSSHLQCEVHWYVTSLSKTDIDTVYTCCLLNMLVDKNRYVLFVRVFYFLNTQRKWRTLSKHLFFPQLKPLTSDVLTKRSEFLMRWFLRKHIDHKIYSIYNVIYTDIFGWFSSITIFILRKKYIHTVGFTKRNESMSLTVVQQCISSKINKKRLLTRPS